MQSGSEQSRKQENNHQPPRGSLTSWKTSQQARSASAACLGFAMFVSSQGKKASFKHLNEPVGRLKVIAAGVCVTALARANSALPLAAGVCSERSYSSRLVSQWLPWRLNHRVLHSVVAGCFRLPRAMPSQTEGRKKR